MATHQETIDELLPLLANAGRVTARKMFGEYCLYLDDKPVALVCDDQLYVKPTNAGRACIPDAREEPPYPKAKPHLFIPRERWAESAMLCELLRSTFDVLPAPKPRKK